MQRALRAYIGRRTANATRMYNRMYNTPERSQTLAQEQRNASSMKSAFNYKSEIDYLNIKALQIGPMTILCPKCNAKKWKDETNGLCCADESDQISIRTNMIPNLKRGLIESLQTVLRENNHLIQSFRSNIESRSFDELQNFKLIIHADRVPQDEHRGQYNAPTIDEVAVLLVNEDKGPRDIVLHGQSGQLSRVSELNRSYDALQYPLMFTRGEDGYHINITQNQRTKTVSCMQFHCYRFMVRETSINHLHYYKTLFSKFAVDMMATIISERLHFIRNHQKQLSADDYVHLQDTVNNDANINANNVGKQPDEIDKIISAEIPNKDRDPTLNEIVCKNMIHGPCGELNIRSPCMNNGKCSKKYPRKLVKDIQTGDDGYPTYRRRSSDDGGYTAILKVRGSDRATFSVNRENDEITNYLNGRYICTSEAFWRIYNFEIHDRDPTVKHLAVHLENGQRVFFNANNLHQVIENPRKTTLAAFFELCSHDNFAKTLLYHEVPSYYTWDDSRGWLKRRRGKDVPGWTGIKMDTAIGRIYTIHPKSNLKAIDGVIHATFKTACFALGLLENDEQWKNALADATVSESPSKLRELFAIIIVFCQPSEPQSLGLIEIEDKVVCLSEKYLIEFGMKSPVRNENTSDPFELLILRSYDDNRLQEFIEINLPKLVNDQKYAFNVITESVMNHQGRVFFLDAPGGTGKTFLLNFLLAQIRSSGKVALAVASSGYSSNSI
ncbi:uncharacterized protein LOC107884118 [Acyrthosiphon pisum]|uniref:ATP-dependent DNA helicase n=1 Tax=Acyrthosiphon pisum TaxID=7029 RepID=A0A8R2H9K8_ACYPI|nr:uncharacterized protein LOC107884118 [Acyrthosiphon pisum]|eukprot:XP_016661099.1 PREDICTED: uncharacterized protein LOC107884118 [Acyrthosiphon pisum]